MNGKKIPDLNMYLKSKLHRNNLYRQLESNLKLNNFFEDGFDEIEKRSFFHFVKDFFAYKTLEGLNLNRLMMLIVFFFIGLEFLVFSK